MPDGVWVQAVCRERVVTWVQCHVHSPGLVSNLLTHHIHTAGDINDTQDGRLEIMTIVVDFPVNIFSLRSNNNHHSPKCHC